VKVLDFTLVGGQSAAFLHWVYDAPTGLGFPGGVTISGPNLSPIPMSNVAAVQAQLDAAFGAGHIVYTIDPTNPDIGYIYGLTAMCVSDHPNLLFWGDTKTYIAKDGLDDGLKPVPGPGVTSYRTVEVIKTVDGSNVTVELREKDGTLIVPQPASADWSLGVCTFDVPTQKIVSSDYVYKDAPGVVPLPANARREFTAHNRNSIDVIVYWTTTNGGIGQIVIPALGSEKIALTEEPAESVFAAMKCDIGLFGTGSMRRNHLVINFIN
jgi:hypothetical protein